MWLLTLTLDGSTYSCCATCILPFVMLPPLKKKNLTYNMAASSPKENKSTCKRTCLYSSSSDDSSVESRFQILDRHTHPRYDVSVSPFILLLPLTPPWLASKPTMQTWPTSCTGSSRIASIYMHVFFSN